MTQLSPLSGITARSTLKGGTPVVHQPSSPGDGELALRRRDICSKRVRPPWVPPAGRWCCPGRQRRWSGLCPSEGKRGERGVGGRIKVGLVGYPVTFDIAFGVQNGILMNKNTMDCLVTITETMKGAPQFATTWSSPDGGKTWVFNLRKNVTWQDGVPFTSNDVKVHFLRLINPKTGSGGATAFFGISTISTPNAHTVVFHLEGPERGVPGRDGSVPRQYSGSPREPEDVC